MPNQKLYQTWVERLEFIDKVIVDYHDDSLVDGLSVLALRVTNTAKSWMGREKSASGKQTWSKLPGEFGNAGKGKTTLNAARKEAKRLWKDGGAKRAKQLAKEEAEAAANERSRLCDVTPIWWESDVVGLKKPKTIEGYSSHVNTLKASPLWEMALRDIRPRHVNAWQKTLLDHPPKANQALAIAKLIGKYAVFILECIDRNPFRDHPRLEEDEPNQPMIAADDRNRMLDAAEASSELVRWAELLQIHIGCRRVDACWIELGDINTATRIWTIPKRKYKTKRKHTFDLDAETMLIAQNAAQWWPKGRDYKGLTHKIGKMKRFHDKLVEKLGIVDPETQKKPGTHAFRRFIGTDIAENEGLIAAQQHLGHASSKTTEIYIKIRDPHRKVVSAALAKRLKEQRRKG